MPNLNYHIHIWYVKLSRTNANINININTNIHVHKFSSSISPSLRRDILMYRIILYIWLDLVTAAVICHERITTIRQRINKTSNAKLAIFIITVVYRAKANILLIDTRLSRTEIEYYNLFTVWQAIKKFDNTENMMKSVLTRRTSRA